MFDQHQHVLPMLFQMLCNLDLLTYVSPVSPMKMTEWILYGEDIDKVFLLGKYWPVIGKSLADYWGWEKVGKILAEYWENVDVYQHLAKYNTSQWAPRHLLLKLIILKSKAMPHDAAPVFETLVFCLCNISTLQFHRTLHRWRYFPLNRALPFLYLCWRSPWRRFQRSLFSLPETSLAFLRPF